MKDLTIYNPDYSVAADNVDLIESPLEWQKRGLRQTATGYGSKLTTHYKVPFNGKQYRVYATCFSNCATLWFTVNGKRYIVD